MATQYSLTNTFTTITEESGTIQNVGYELVELASSTNAVAGEGIVLNPGEKRSFKGTLSARSIGDAGAAVNVVDFTEAGEGGEYTPMYVPVGSVAFASLPTTLTKSMLGWTYNVTDAFVTDSRFIEGSDVSYPAGQNVVVVEPSADVYKYDCFAGAYILPIASDTELGGVKISNSFTVSNDGTLNIKKAGKTILGAVKSSDDEGKVTVNNDATMTYNPLGYRQPSTVYAVGDMKYHSALPTGWYLECTTAGTSGSGDLSIGSPAIGDTVTDGTVVWTIRQCASTNNLTSFTSGILTTNGHGISRTRNDSQANFYGGTPGSSARLKLVGGEDSNLPGGFALSANDGENSCTLEGTKDGVLLWGANDLAGSAIVAKSLGANGYIQYASGLIIQWGRITKNVPDNTNINEQITATFPISFPNEILDYVATPRSYDSVQKLRIAVTNTSTSAIICSIEGNVVANTFYGYSYLVVGY